jgi:glutamyl-tRNA synthetase
MQVIQQYGLDWDEGPDKGGPFAPYVQSQRLHIYKEYVDTLIKNGKAYFCFCTKDRLEQMREEQIAHKQLPKYDRHCRGLSPDIIQKNLTEDKPYVIRLKVPDHQPISFTDLIRGQITIESDTIDDQVLLKSDGFPTYHLAVVVDDYLMQITHVLRGEEWISSTPKHILLYAAFGWQPPVYAHIPVFLNPDGQGKMSKRKGTVSAQSFLDNGYLPEALLNFFMILGWAPADQREILSLDEYIKEFNPAQISAKSVVFDMQKLNWLNGMYIRKLSAEQLTTQIQKYLPEDFPQEKLAEILPLVSERLVTLKDIESLTDFFYRPISHDRELLLKKADPKLVDEQLTQTRAAIADATEWTLAALEQAIRSLQESSDWKKSQYFMLVRVAVTGRTATPPLFETIHVIGKEEVLARLTAALASIQ